MKTMHMKKIAVGLLTFTVVCLTVPVFAQTAAREYSLEIERQPVAAALTEFSRQTGLQIGYFPETLTEDVLVGPLSGYYTADSAITQLLLPSGLSFERLNERTIAVTKPRSDKSQRRGFLATGRKTDLRAPHSFLRLADLRLAEKPLAEDAQRIETATNAQESNNKQRLPRGLEEVIVSAQKREERLQDVPISISVLGGDDLDRSTAEGMTEALSRVPGTAVNVTYQGGGTQVVMRGVTAGGALFAGSSPISYYLDSIPFGLVKSAIAPDANSYDLERVEVLRGPQGTLYGASAQNGVVRVLTKDANPDEFELKARTSASAMEGGGENYRGDMAVNVPIIDGKLAARAVLGYQSLGGWIDRPNKSEVNDAEIRNMRLKINAKPTDQLSIGLSAWLSRADYGGPSTSDHEDRQVALLDEPFSTDFDALGLKVGYDFSGFSVASMTSYLDYENDSFRDLVYFFADTLSQTHLEAEVVAQEVILNSTHDGSWRWSLGGVYRHAEDLLLSRTHFLQAPPPITGTDESDISKSFAIFGELTRLFLDGQLEFTAGLRHFEDDVTGRENSNGAGESLIRTSRKFDALSPRVVLTWHSSDQLTTYVSYAEGFRSGFDQYATIKRIEPGFPPLKSDNLMNYELGVKGDLLDGRMNFDAAFYYMDWQDVQQSLTVNVNDLPYTAHVNGDSASGIGFDFGVTMQPVDGLELGVTLSWNDLTMDSEVFSAGALLFAKGDRLNLSPEYTVGASADYVFPLGRNGIEGRFSASASYTSEMDLRTIVGGDQSIALGDPMLIARTSFAVHALEHWVATVFVDNINNERGSAVRFPFVPGVITDWDASVRPRTMGVQLEYRF